MNVHVVTRRCDKDSDFDYVVGVFTNKGTAIELRDKINGEPRGWAVIGEHPVITASPDERGEIEQKRN